MGLWLTNHVSMKSGGGDLNIGRKFFSLPVSSAKKALVTDALEMARFWLVYMSGVLKASYALDDDVNAAAAKYFLTPAGGPSIGDLNAIKRTIVKMMNGMNDNVAIKLSGSDSRGYVGVHRKGDVFEDNYGSWSPGEIHVSRKRFSEDPPGALRTLIHEASHKFAGTEDWAYVGLDGNGWRKGGVRKTLTSKEEALWNADSYAWFIFTVCQNRGVLGGA